MSGMSDFVNYLKLTNTDWNQKPKIKVHDRYSKEAGIYFVGADEIRELNLYPTCPVCGSPVICWVSLAGEVICFGCPHHFGDYDVGFSWQEAATAWNSFVQEKFVAKYAKMKLFVASAGIGIFLFFDASVLTVILELISTLIALLINPKKLSYRKMNADIEEFLKKFPVIDNEADCSFEGKSNCEILKIQRSKILDIMEKVDDAKFKVNSVLLCDIVRKSILYLEENPEYDSNASELVRRMEQFQNIIEIYLKTNKYGGDREILDQSNQAIIELKPVFQELYRNLMQMQEFGSMASLKVIRQDIKGFSDWHGINQK